MKSKTSALNRKVFTIITPSTTGNVVMNIPRVRRHAHLWKEVKKVRGAAIRCVECGKTL